MQNGPHTYQLKAEGRTDSVVIEARYIPVPITLEPRETVNSKFIRRSWSSNNILTRVPKTRVFYELKSWMVVKFGVLIKEVSSVSVSYLSYN